MRSCEVPVDGFGTLVVVLGLLEEVVGVTRSSGPPVLGKSGRLRRIRSSSRPCQTAVNSEQTRGHVKWLLTSASTHAQKVLSVYRDLPPLLSTRYPGLSFPVSSGDGLRSEPDNLFLRGILFAESSVIVSLRFCDRLDWYTHSAWLRTQFAHFGRAWRPD